MNADKSFEPARHSEKNWLRIALWVPSGLPRPVLQWGSVCPSWFGEGCGVRSLAYLPLVTWFHGLMARRILPLQTGLPLSISGRCTPAVVADQSFVLIRLTFRQLRCSILTMRCSLFRLAAQKDQMT